MKKNFLFLPILFLLIFSACADKPTETTTLGGVYGTVFDQSNNLGLLGVTVSIPNIGNRTTESNGFYQFNDLEENIYTITAEKSGYVTETTQVEIEANKNKEVNFTLHTVQPTADFIGTPTNGVEPLTVSFYDESDPGSTPITSWLWDFGDEGSSISQNPTYIYNNSGTYTVSLTVQTNVGSDTKTRINYIFVDEAAPSPTDPIPINNSMNNETTLTLYWSTNSNRELLYDVYFGTDPSPDEGELVSEQQLENSYTISILLHNGTTYYWKIVVWEGNNSTVGDIWSFTTEQTTTVSYYSFQDTQAWEGYPGYNYGSDGWVQMGRMDWASWYREYGYFHFDLTSNDLDGKFPIPLDANIADGAFSLCLYIDRTNGSFGANDYFQVRKVTNWWQENTLTWSNKPSSEPSPGGSWWYGPFYVDQFYEFSDNNFTHVIRDWISSPSDNFGMVFEPANFDDTDISVCSKDYGDFTKWPIMTITYQW